MSEPIEQMPPLAEAPPLVEGPLAATLPGAEAALPTEPLEATPPEPGRLARLLRRVFALFPWLSLGLSVWSAFEMKRDESQARWVAAFAAGSWILMLVVSIVLGAVERHATAAWIKGVARFSMTALAQNVLQLCLYFALPLYLFSFAFTLPQAVFLGLLAAAAVVLTWDPFCERALESAPVRALLTAFVSFSAMAAVLPMLGLPHGPSLWIAAVSVAVFAPLLRYLELGRQSLPVFTIVFSALLPVLLFFGLARAIPPAPLRVAELGIGTGVEKRVLVGASEVFESAPARLHCFSAIVAPLGLREDLEHVWIHDGKAFEPITLEVRGGRKEGFRTWSRRSPGKNPSGKWACEVRTPMGQVLGKARARIE